MPKRILSGKIIKDSRDKTVTIIVERKYRHPVLKKVLKVKKKYHAHDENNEFKIGQNISIIETNPISKQKTFKVLKEDK